MKRLDQLSCPRWHHVEAEPRLRSVDAAVPATVEPIREGRLEIGRPVGHRIPRGCALALLQQDAAVRVVNGDIVQVLERDERFR